MKNERVDARLNSLYNIINDRGKKIISCFCNFPLFKCDEGKIKDLYDKFRNIQTNLLEFLRKKENEEENFQNLKIIFDDNKITDNFNYLILCLSLVSSISLTPHKFENFFVKIERIIKYFENGISKLISHKTLMNIFGINKRMLLFLLNEKMIENDNEFIEFLFKESYNGTLIYFIKEIGRNIGEEEKKKILRSGIGTYEISEDALDGGFYDEDEENERIKKLFEDVYKKIEEDAEDFDENRMKGVNESDICKIIREDEVKKFITYVKNYNLNLNSNIPKSIFEANEMLNDKKTISLIEYATFYNSGNILKYLIINGVNVDEQLLKFATFADMSIFKIVEDLVGQTKKIWEDSIIVNDILETVIKCHNIDRFFFVQGKVNVKSGLKIIENSLLYHNFVTLNTECDERKEKLLSLIILAEYKYYPFINIICEDKKIVEGDYYFKLKSAFSDYEITFSMKYNKFGEKNTAVRVDERGVPIKTKEIPYFKVDHVHVRGDEGYKLIVPFESKVIVNVGGLRKSFLCGSNNKGKKILEYYIGIPLGFEFYFEFNYEEHVLPPGTYKLNGEFLLYYLCEEEDWEGGVYNATKRVGSFVNLEIEVKTVEEEI